LEWPLRVSGAVCTEFTQMKEALTFAALKRTKNEILHFSFSFFSFLFCDGLIGNFNGAKVIDSAQKEISRRLFIKKNVHCSALQLSSACSPELNGICNPYPAHP
jgi:hypothetical protein